MPHKQVDELIAKYGADAVIEAVTPMLEDTRIETLERGLDSKLQSITIVLENLYDPHNGAAAMRSSEAFGLCDMHTIDGSTGTFKAAKDVSVGTGKWIDLHNHASPKSCAQSLKDKGFVLCATLPGASMELEEIPVDKPLAIWFGNERDGLSAEAQELCDHKVSIEMFGFCQSFNLSVSVAMFVHRLASKRRSEIGAVSDLDPVRRAHLQARWRATGIRGLSHVLERYVSS